MKKISLLYTLLLTFVIVPHAFSAQEASTDNLTIVAVGEAEAEKDNLLFFTPDLKKSSHTSILRTALKIIKADFKFYGHLFEINEEGSSLFTSEIKKKSRYQVTMSLTEDEKSITLFASVYDQFEKKELVKAKHKYEAQIIRTAAHSLSDQIYRSITGKRSIFTSKIMFVSDRTSSKSKLRKELYIMDFDGERKQRLTFKRSMVISPALSNDNSKAVYSLIEDKWTKSTTGRPQKIKNLNLYLMDLATRKVKLLSSKKGINSGAVFDTSGENIYLTLSNQRNADIFKMNLKTRALKQVTKHFAEDVDPHAQPGGNLLTFLSGRSGRAMIYTLELGGVEKKVKRISYVGKFNAAPRFNPQGTEIAFSSWVDNRFDIYRIDSSGKNLVRLTKNMGSNEEAWFSPDGEFIVFSSQKVINSKSAIQDLYIMNREGVIIKNITNGYGKSYTPRWSNY